METVKKNQASATKKDLAVKKDGNSAQQTEVTFKDLRQVDVPVDVLKEIPEEAAAFYRLAPIAIAKEDRLLQVGMIDPSDFKAKEALRFIAQRSGLRTQIFLIDQAGLDNVLKQYRTLRGEVKKALQELEKEMAVKEDIKPISRKKTTVERVSVEAPITKIVAVILRHATEGRASDVHIEPVEDEIRVRFRVDGVLHTSLILPKEIHAAIVSRIKILSNLKIDETRVPQDGRFHTVIAGNKVDFRVSTLPTASGEKVVLRVLDTSSGVKNFSELGIQGYNAESLEKAIQQPFGMILITGPTGSGKTTTLYSILNMLNKETVNIVSLEDPVEYYMEGINQSQIRPEIEYSFASGLRHILRQDPDVIMVGEIRDEETATLAIHAALTGHILLSTLHTNNAIGVIPRLIDLKISSFLLPAALNVAIAQRLARRLCPKCKKAVEPSPKIKEIIEKEISLLTEEQRKDFPYNESSKVYQPVGCKFCGGKGTKGRIALLEILKMTPQLEKALSESMGEATIKAEAKRQGMITMRQDGVLKVLQGIISFEEMLEKVEG